MRYRILRNFSTSLLAIAGTAIAYADPDADFAARCAAPGVVVCVGFDDQAATNAIGQVRYPATSGPASRADNPQAYPNNIAPNGYRYPAVDRSQAASGAGSLRLTANPVGSANQSGGWYLGSAGISNWPRTFGAGDTFYIQWRQRYDFAYTNEVRWNSVGGEGNKNIILWRNEGSCSDMEVTLHDGAHRGYPQIYTNCGGRPLYQCPAGSGGSKCGPENTDYAPLKGHRNFLYQNGPNNGDFACMRDSESPETCGYWRDHHDTWWTYYIKVQIGTPRDRSSTIQAWMSRGNGEPMRQFIDYNNFPWNFASGSEMQNLMFTLYKTAKSSGNHKEATTWYDELIISSEPIATPENVGQASNAPRAACDSRGDISPCPPTGIITEQ